MRDRGVRDGRGRLSRWVRRRWRRMLRWRRRGRARWSRGQRWGGGVDLGWMWRWRARRRWGRRGWRGHRGRWWGRQGRCGWMRRWLGPRASGTEATARLVVPVHKGRARGVHVPVLGVGVCEGGEVEGVHGRYVGADAARVGQAVVFVPGHVLRNHRYRVVQLRMEAVTKGVRDQRVRVHVRKGVLRRLAESRSHGCKRWRDARWRGWRRSAGQGRRAGRWGWERWGGRRVRNRRARTQPPPQPNTAADQGEEAQEGAALHPSKRSRRRGRATALAPPSPLLAVNGKGINLDARLPLLPIRRVGRVGVALLAGSVPPLPPLLGAHKNGLALEEAFTARLVVGTAAATPAVPFGGILSEGICLHALLPEPRLGAASAVRILLVARLAIPLPPLGRANKVWLAREQPAVNKLVLVARQHQEVRLPLSRLPNKANLSILTL